ncbi:MAG: polyprenyl synthetase family protein [Oscillospiraceae bacterium]|nr:polyprenyl synthetase family protein [Oscillospiraceae bacterium]
MPEQYLKVYQQQVENTLQRMMETVFPPQAGSAVARAAAYSLLGGGKRVRGVLTLAASALVCGDAAPAESYAAALEMLHCYSLIHDDLPCMDNDDFRRGRPSCHKAFGETTALLAGDALLTAAFETLCRNENGGEKNARAVQLLAHAAGPHGMVLGQELDLAAEETPVDEAGLLLIHTNKTGRLLRAAVGLGAIAAGASGAQAAALDGYAERIGMVFQIVDDILDVTATSEELGKPIGSDAENNKTTFVTLKGIDAARAEAERLTREACVLLQNTFGKSADFLCNYAQKLVERSN